MRMRALLAPRKSSTFIKTTIASISSKPPDGQMRQILSGLIPEQAPKFRSAAHSDGPVVNGQMDQGNHPCPGGKSMTTPMTTISVAR